MSTSHSVQPPGAPGRTHGAPAGHGLWADFLHHGQRWLRCDFTRMWAEPGERAALAAATPPITEPAVQDYVAWRRSMAWIAALFAAIATLDELIRLFALDTGKESGLTGFVSFLQFLTVASHAALLVALIQSARGWTQPGRDRLRLRWAWAIALLVPVVVMLLPLTDLAFDWSQARELRADETTAAATVSTLGVMFGIVALFTALPGLFSIFPGAIRSGAILKTLLPGRSLGPVVLLVLAPIYALFLLVACTVLQQVGNNILFLFGSLLLLASPVVSFKAAWALVPPCTKGEAGERVTRYRLLARWPAFCGLGLLVIGLLSAKLFGFRFVGYGNAFLEVHRLLLMAVWFFAMLTTYTVVSCDVLLQGMRTADEMRERAEASPEFQRDTQALRDFQVALMDLGPSVPPPPTTSPT
jgi:hypothetical protein